MQLLYMNLYFICQILSSGIFFTFQTKFTCKSSESLLIALRSFIIIFFIHDHVIQTYDVLECLWDMAV